MPKFKSLSFCGLPDHAVGDDGSFWSWRMNRSGVYRWKKLKGTVTKSGHIRVSPYYNQKHLLHRLVALAFLGECPLGKQVCHDNGVPSDNRVSNLYYGTPKNNSDDKFRHGTMPVGEKHSLSKLTDLEVQEIVEKHAAKRPTESSRSFCRRHATFYGVSPITLGAIIRSQRIGRRHPKKKKKNTRSILA